MTRVGKYENWCDNCDVAWDTKPHPHRDCHPTWYLVDDETEAGL